MINMVAPFVENSFFSIVYFWLLYQNSSNHRFVDLCLSPKFDSSDKYDNFHADIMFYLKKYYNSVVQLEISDSAISGSSFIVQFLLFGIFPVFLMKMSIARSNSVRTCVGILMVKHRL